MARNFLSEAEISCHRKKFLATEQNFLSQEGISCHSYKFLISGRNFLSQEEISCQRQKCPVTGRNFLALEEISCHRKTLLVTGRNFMPQENQNYHYFEHLLSRLTPAVLGKIFGWKYWLPRIEIFYPTLLRTHSLINFWSQNDPLALPVTPLYYCIILFHSKKWGFFQQQKKLNMLDLIEIQGS